jgi:hypothetical protein
MNLTRREVSVLMRSLLRSLESTPEREQAEHKAIYEKLSAESVRLLPAGLLKRVGRALDHAIGR